MKYFDLHADTILPVLQGGEEASLRANKEICVDLDGLIEGQALAQCFAVWLPEAEGVELNIDPRLEPKNQEEDMAYIRLAKTRLVKEFETNSDVIAQALNSADVRCNEENGLISGILTMEDGRAVNGDMDNLKLFYDWGFRMISLTWNSENCFGHPTSKDPALAALGLKPFGKEAIATMNDLGLLIDVSHLSDGGIEDCLALSKAPVIASHSNARAIANHQRNLPDYLIKGIAESGGVAGLCFSPRFLREDGEGSRIDDMIRHLNHMVDIGGEDILAIGTDFDGTWGEFDIPRANHMQKLFDALDAHGWSSERIEKLAYKNAVRVFENL